MIFVTTKVTTMQITTFRNIYLFNGSIQKTPTFKMKRCTGHAPTFMSFKSLPDKRKALSRLRLSRSEAPIIPWIYTDPAIHPGRLTAGSPTAITQLENVRKEHDLNQTSMRTCSNVNLQVCSGLNEDI